MTLVHLDTEAALVKARKHGLIAGKPGDLILLNADAVADTWVAFEIALVDDDGDARAVRDKDGRVVALGRLTARAEKFLVRAALLADGAVAAVCGQPCQGIAGARALLAPYRRGAGE